MANQIILGPRYVPIPVTFPASGAVVVALARERVVFGIGATKPGLDAIPTNSRDIVTPILAWRPRVAASQPTDARNDPDHIETGELWTPKS